MPKRVLPATREFMVPPRGSFRVLLFPQAETPVWFNFDSVLASDTAPTSRSSFSRLACHPRQLNIQDGQWPPVAVHDDASPTASPWFPPSLPCLQRIPFCGGWDP